MHNKQITIGIVSKQWGVRTDCGWSICFQNDNNRYYFGSGAGSVPKTSSYSEGIFREVYATRAALIFLQRQLTSIWNIQRLRITVLSGNQWTISTLEKLYKTEAHNPRWHLNRNWELLHGIMNDLKGQLLKVKMALDNDERHKSSLKVANTLVLKYQESNVKMDPKLLSTQQIGRAYLWKGYERINEV
jgi:hypothetical protein